MLPTPVWNHLEQIWMLSSLKVFTAVWSRLTAEYKIIRAMRAVVTCVAYWCWCMHRQQPFRVWIAGWYMPSVNLPVRDSRVAIPLPRCFAWHWTLWQYGGSLFCCVLHRPLACHAWCISNLLNFMLCSGLRLFAHVCILRIAKLWYEGSCLEHCLSQHSCWSTLHLLLCAISLVYHDMCIIFCLLLCPRQIDFVHFTVSCIVHSASCSIAYGWHVQLGPPCSSYLQPLYCQNMVWMSHSPSLHTYWALCCSLQSCVTAVCITLFTQCICPSLSTLCMSSSWVSCMLHQRDIDFHV